MDWTRTGGWVVAAVLLTVGCSEPAPADPDAAPLVCPAGFDDCNGDPTDGCEADLSSASSCGDCATDCVAPSDGVPICMVDTCDFECRADSVRCQDACSDSCPFSFTDPGVTQFSIPVGCNRVRIIAWGAGGGNGRGNTDAGAGGFAQAEVAVEPGETWNVFVGSPGGDGTVDGPGAGGQPGGGEGGTGGSQAGGGGGGYTGAFRGNPVQATAILIAGGGGGSGGGSGNPVLAGAGGGLEGQTGNANGSTAAGTQTLGFGALVGGDGTDRGGGDDGGGGGGGGWFGGSGGAGADTDAHGGGGGSGFVEPGAQAVDLQTGDRGLAGNATQLDRGTAGDPGSAGAMIVTCIPGT